MRNIFFPHYLSGEPDEPFLNKNTICTNKKKRHSKVSLCTPAGARTLDPLIKSQMLYQLSYKRVPNN